MIATSQAWKDNQNKQVRSESDIKLTFYKITTLNVGNIQYEYGVVDTTLTKEHLASFHLKESGALNNNKLPICEINFSIYKNGKVDFDERGFVVVEFGYNINGTWEWIQKGIYKISKKEIPVNGLLAHYTLKSCFGSNPYTDIDDIYKEGSYQTYDTSLRNIRTDDLMSKLQMQEDGVVTTNYTVGSYLGYVSFLELARQIGIVKGKTTSITNQAKLKLLDTLNNRDVVGKVIRSNCYNKPEKTSELKFDIISIIGHSLGSSSSTKSSYTVTTTKENEKIYVEPSLYASAQIVGGAVYSILWSAYTINQPAGTYNIELTNLENDVLTTNSFVVGLGSNELKIDTPLLFQYQTVNVAFGLIDMVNTHNIVYSVDCRIDPSFELFDLIDLEIEKGIFKRGFIESISIDYNGGFSGSLEIRTLFDYEKPLTFKNISNNNATVMATFVGSANPNLQYSIDGGSWRTYSTSGTELTLPSGSTISFKGTNASGFSSSSTNYVYFSCDQECEISGNLMTLIDPSGETTEIPNNYCFYGLFTGIQTISNIPSNLLMATILKENCYTSLFDSSINVTSKAVHGVVNLVISSQVITANAFYYMFRAQTFDDDLTIDFRQATTINSPITLGSISKVIGGVSNFVKKTYIFSTALTTINATSIGITGDYSLQKLVFEFTDNDVVNFDVSKIIPQGTDNKSSCSFEIWTDNTSIVNGCVAKRNEYTTINAFHLDGTSWGL